jgi:four helix bundle protein
LPNLFPFEKLDTWQKARELVKSTYLITKDLPDQEKFGLISQINRASVSVASNLAEGSSRITPKDQAHFFSLAFSSLTELMCQIILIKDLGLLYEEKYLMMRNKIEELGYKINGLRKSALEKGKKPN